MSRPSQRKRPRRTYRWEGRVIDVEAGAFSADIVPLDHDGPSLWARFDRRQLPEAEPGLVFTVYIHQRGQRVRTVVRARDYGRWTEQELKAARARAAKWVKEVAPLWLVDN